MNIKPEPLFYIILMPRGRISEIHFNDNLDQPIKVLKRSETEKKEYKTRPLEKLVKYFTVNYRNKKYQMSDIFQISGEGDEYLDYLKIEGTFINFANSIDLLYTFMKDFRAQNFEWVMMDYSNKGPQEFASIERFHNYLLKFWKECEPSAVAKDPSTMKFKHPSEIQDNSRIKPKWR